MSVTEPVSTTHSDADDITTTVLTAVAARIDVSVRELPPLYEVVDPDALNDVLGRRGVGPARSGVRVEFSFAGCLVSVQDGSVTVREAPTPTDETPTLGHVEGN